MKRMKSWMAWLAAAGLAAAAAAEEITARQAGTAARNWVERGYAMGKLPPGQTVAGVDDLSDPVTGAQLHVVRFEGGGFVVTSGDDLVEPVLAFSETGDTVDPDEQNPFWALLRADISAREAAAGIDRKAGGRKPAVRATRTVAKEESPPSASRRRWEELLDEDEEDGPDRKRGAAKATWKPSDLRVDSFVKSRWSQGDVGGKYCYNFFTPNHCWSGCSATALGQIMRYWEYPAQYATPLTTTCHVEGVEKKMSMLKGVCAWDKMPLTPSEENLTEEKCKAIGKLLYNIGVSIGMYWSTNGSAGDFGFTAARVLKDCFGYANAAVVIDEKIEWSNIEGATYANAFSRVPWSIAEFKKAFIPNMEARCPVGLTIYDRSLSYTNLGQIVGGHAVVGDGYGFSGGDFFIHINYGWGGGNDAWYRPPDPNNFNTGRIDCHNWICCLLCNVHPRQKGNILSGRVLDKDGRPVGNASVALLSEGEVIANTNSDSKGIYAFFTEKTDPLAVKASHGNRLGITTVASKPGAFVWSVGNSYGNDVVLYIPVVTRFVADGAIPEIRTRIDIVGNSYGAMPVPRREEYAFLGWYTKETGGTKVSSTDKIPTNSPRTFYAYWTKDQTVKFNGNGGLSGVSKRTVTIGNAYGTLPTATWPGHVFLGWFTKAEGGDAVTEASKVPETLFRTLYAHWTTDQTVKFNGNGGKAAEQTKLFTMGGTYGGLPVASRSGFAFLGWFTEAVGGTAVTAADTVPDILSRTLHAHWGAKTTFKWNSNTQARQYTVGEPYGTLPEVTWTGHAFLGWYTAETGGTAVSASSTVPATGTRTLYAHWTTTQATTFYGNGGTPAVQTTTNPIGAKYGTLPKATWAKHAFLGWYTKPTGGTKISGSSTVTAEATRTLYAHWTTDQVTMFRWNDGTDTQERRTNTVGNTYGAMPVPNWARHAFLGWFTDRTAGSAVWGNYKVTAVATRTLYAHWTTNQVTVFKTNDGTPAAQVATNAIGGKYKAFPKVTWAGHAFLGWFTEMAGGKAVPASSTVTATATRTLYAHWTADQVVTFAANGGSCAVAKTTNAIGKAYGTLPTPTWAGHAFLGWFTKADGGAKITATSTVTAAAARALHAHWTTDQVTMFRWNDGTDTLERRANAVGSTYGAMPAPRWPKHAFLGWYTAAEGGSAIWGTHKVTAKATRTLYAHWKTTQTVEFKKNDGTSWTLLATNAIGEKYGTLPTVTWAGHTFLGWFTDAKGGQAVAKTDLVTETALRTLFAHWAVAKGTSKVRPIFGFAVDSLPRARTTRGTDGLGVSFQIRFEAEAGVEYEIQWTSALGGEWKPLRRWVAEADGEAAVEVCPPDGDPVGFFRLIVPDSPGASED